MYWEKSSHSQFSYWLCLIAVSIEFFLGMNNLNTYFGTMALVEAGLGLFSLLVLDVIHGKKFSFKPKKFKPINVGETFRRFAVIFIVIVAIQYLFQIVPLVTSSEMALGVVMVAPIEEYFFRGVLMEPFFRWGAKSKDKIILWNYNPKKKKADIKISYVEIAGIILSGVIFASFHVSYYDQRNLMWMVFAGGCWLSFCYFLYKDLTPLILAHFLLNIWFMAQYYQVLGL